MTTPRSAGVSPASGAPPPWRACKANSAPLSLLTRSHKMHNLNLIYLRCIPSPLILESPSFFLAFSHPNSTRSQDFHLTLPHFLPEKSGSGKSPFSFFRTNKLTH
eukprot:RCo034301